MGNTTMGLNESVQDSLEKRRSTWVLSDFGQVLKLLQNSIFFTR